MTPLIRAKWALPLASAVMSISVIWHLLDTPAPLITTPPEPQATQVRYFEPAMLDKSILAPPFSPSRMPEGAAGQISQEAASAAAPPTVGEPPKLVGAVVRLRGNGVALVRQTDGKTVTLARGASVDGWTLVRITRDQADFVQHGEIRSARLEYNAKATSTAHAEIPLPPADTQSAPFALGDPYPLAGPLP